MAVQHYPLDFDTLQKGQRITALEIERIVGVGPTHKSYHLRALGLRMAIERNLQLRGALMTLRMDHDDLIICEDAEASEYNHRHGQYALRKYARCHVRNMAVEVSNLTDEERKRHERTLLVQGSLLSAIKKTRDGLQLTGAVRKTPGLPKPEKGNGENT